MPLTVPAVPDCRCDEREDTDRDRHGGGRAWSGRPEDPSGGALSGAAATAGRGRRIESVACLIKDSRTRLRHDLHHVLNVHVPYTKEGRDRVTVQRMDNVGIVVDDLPAA